MHFHHCGMARRDFLKAAGTAAVTLSGPSGLLKQNGNVLVASGMATSPETPVLVMLIWYVRLLMNEDAAVVAVIGATG